VAQRRKNAGVFSEMLSNVPFLNIPLPNEKYFHAYYKFYVFLKEELLPLGYTRDRILKELLEMGLSVYSGGCPEIYLEKAFTDRRLGPKKRLPMAKKLGESSLMFVVHPTLSTNESI
jgi:dTDP-4-amino-4,6-dideoxygalactose transaminase